MTASGSSPRSELARRVKTPSDEALPFCTVPGCGRAPEARQGNGLSPTLCRYHREFRRRHGSPLKRSYTGAELKPYVRAAESFAKAHKADPFIKRALERIGLELSLSGPVQHANDLLWLELRAKARTSLAKLRERNVPPLRILAVTLGVLAAIEEDTYGPGGDRVLFRRVQIAKALRRRASGSHVVYESGWRFSRYPRSSGKVLEALGAIGVHRLGRVAPGEPPGRGPAKLSGKGCSLVTPEARTAQEKRTVAVGAARVQSAPAVAAKDPNGLADAARSLRPLSPNGPLLWMFTTERARAKMARAYPDPSKES
jgi:hypothetical protein